MPMKARGAAEEVVPSGAGAFEEMGRREREESGRGDNRLYESRVGHKSDGPEHRGDPEDGTKERVSSTPRRGAGSGETGPGGHVCPASPLGGTRETRREK